MAPMPKGRRFPVFAAGTVGNAETGARPGWLSWEYGRQAEVRGTAQMPKVSKLWQPGYAGGGSGAYPVCWADSGVDLSGDASVST